jgi:hypothetical protein
VPGWVVDTGGGGWTVGIDTSQHHSGKESAEISSNAKPDTTPDQFGNLMQWIDATPYRGKHFRFSGWVKSDVASGWAGLWVRVDGDWTTTRRDCFDNMQDRPIKGQTDWKQYSVVVDVPPTSTQIFFGCLFNGKGKIWIDDTGAESVSTDVPLTGTFTSANKFKSSVNTVPQNLDFEQR